MQAEFDRLEKSADRLVAIADRWEVNVVGKKTAIESESKQAQEIVRIFVRAAGEARSLVEKIKESEDNIGLTWWVTHFSDQIAKRLAEISWLYGYIKEKSPEEHTTKEFNRVEQLSLDFIELLESFVVLYEEYSGAVIVRDAHSTLDSTEQRLSRLEEFAIEHGGVGVANFARSIFPELSRDREQLTDQIRDNIPSQPPEIWPGARGNPESPPDFIRRVYGPWLGNGLTRAHIRDLDPPLATGLDNWLRRNEMPNDIDLPTATEWITRRLERLQADPDKPTTMTLSEARRLIDTERKRTHRSRASSS